MATLAAAMMRPGHPGLDSPYHLPHKLYETEGSKKKWPSRIKTGGGGTVSGRSPVDRYDSGYMYGTISAPGGSALSKSMKYAETWLYGTVRTHPTSHRPSLFAAYPEPPGPVLVRTPQKPAQNYAVILCSCPEYLNGTKKSSSTKVSICKKCKGSRFPIAVQESPRALLGGTVRGPTVAREAGVLRAGTVKLQSSKLRPSILKAQNDDSIDPYNLMRKSRLAPPHEARIGSQFSTARTRAKSISPSRKSGTMSPLSDVSRKNRSKSVSRVNEMWIEDNPDYPVDSKRSILSNDVNAYELMNSGVSSSKSKVEIEFDDDFNMFKSNYSETSIQYKQTSSFKAIGGQRIRIIDETKTCTVEDVSVYDSVNMKGDLKKYDLKTQELSASLPISNGHAEKPKKKINSHYNPPKKGHLLTSSPLSKTKNKVNSPKRPPRKIKLNKNDDDSESDSQNEPRRSYSEKRTPLNFKSVRHTNRQNDTIKSILKKPRISINETYHKSEKEVSDSSEDRQKNAQFYLPTPTNSAKNTITARKRVQFLVENDDTKIIYTAEFDFTENSSIRNVSSDCISSPCTIEEIHDDTEQKTTVENCDENKDTKSTYEDVTVQNSSNNEQINVIGNVNENNCYEDLTNLPKYVVLRRSESERLQTNSSISPKFLDSMALRTKPNKIHTSQVFFTSNGVSSDEKYFNITTNEDTGAVICKSESPDATLETNNNSSVNSNSNIDWSFDAGNISDNSDITAGILRNLRKSISVSPEPPPRLKSKDHIQMKSRKNNYVKTRFVRTDSISSTSDEYSDNCDSGQKTVLRVKQFENENFGRKLVFDNSYEDCDEPRRTSIQINGDDCYSTMNVTNDSPVYLSSVVVNDDYSTSTYQSGSTVTISINSPEDKVNRSNSNVYIGACSEDPYSQNKSFKNDTSRVANNVEDLHKNDKQRHETSSVKENSNNKCSKLDNEVSENELKQLSVESADKEQNLKKISKTGFVARLLDDPTLGHLAEGLDSELVTKLIENSLIKLQESKASKNDEESVNDVIENSISEINISERNTTKSEVAKTNSEDDKIEKTPTPVSDVANMISSEIEENGCSAPYESMEYESGMLGISSDLEPLSDCYNASASELSTEDDGNSRSKLYQMLVDAALCEIEVANNPDDDHLYESIRLNGDPIYEEICDIPPPLPNNPPPSSLLGLDDDKKSGSRSIFEGASKYDILSYLVDAKERGIDSEETYITSYGPEPDSETVVEEAKTVEVIHERTSSDMCSNTSQLSNSSDSSEDNSLVIGAEVVEKAVVCKKTSAEIERNDSGVGSETSKTSRSRWQGRSSPSNVLLDKESPIHLCEDCDAAVETQITESGAMYAPLVCRKCAKKRTERKEIIMEIVETEEKYGRDLQIILEEFYKPMLVAGLLSQEQLSAIFLNVEELIENNQILSEKMRDALEIAIEQGDEDLLTVNIGKLMVECAPMLAAFQGYCVRQAGAALLLAGLEKEKELLRIFLRVSQMENAVLRRMNLNSFLMVPVQRVTKYPLLLSRLYRATAACAADREDARLAQRSVEERLSDMNQAAAAAAAAARDVPLWRRLAAARRTARDLHVADIRLRKMAVDVLEWNHDEARFAMEGKLLFTQPNDNNWRKGRTIKLTPINALLVTNGKATETYKPTESLFPRASGVREAALLLVREKAGRYTLQREPLYLDRCVIAADAEPEHFFEVHEITTKDSFIFKAEENSRTRAWYRQLQFHAQGVGAWRRRRNALANIMINPMLTRN